MSLMESPAGLENVHNTLPATPPPAFTHSAEVTHPTLNEGEMFSWNISKQLFIFGFTESCLKHHRKGKCQTENRSAGKCLNPTRSPAALKCVVFVGLHLAVRLIPSPLKMKMGEGAVNPHKNIFEDELRV